MTLEEIKAAVDAGRKVYWATRAYEVRKSKTGSYYIICILNNYVIGLTHTDGVTMNGEPEQFFEEEREEKKRVREFTKDLIAEVNKLMLEKLEKALDSGAVDFDLSEKQGPAFMPKTILVALLKEVSRQAQPPEQLKTKCGKIVADIYNKI